MAGKAKKGTAKRTEEWTLLRDRYEKLLPSLAEKQRRLVVGSDVMAFGIEVTLAARLSGLSRQTIYRGLRELEAGEVGAPGRSRRPGGGRKPITETQPGLVDQLEALIEPGTRGDPMTLLRWTAKSTRNLAAALVNMGFTISHDAVRRLLHSLGYSLKGNAKNVEGKQHEDRDRQFKFIERQSRRFQNAGEPVISVDTKKKELVGNYKNGGKEWGPKGKKTDVRVHDFIDPNMPKAVPYGIYDVADDSGFFSVGISSDTAEFAVQALRNWYRQVGKKRYPKARKILICADAGGSNGVRVRLWKAELQKLADETKLEISVSHYPPGTSKWNKIEHRLFSFVSINWRARPLLSYKVVIDLIAATTTKAGLTVRAILDRRQYEKGRKISNEEMEALNIRRERFHGEWNYTICPSC